ncbi:DUF3794 and LysM peptidoglycan-binding domain-containing protein [Crassaminicella profunda]|uniref:DUF3794 and LysM peptidoglycan-binding domain-containing protein n=1 Tax=Crassaminicella profunda TaxID=1286698 RepID=UPI001CA658F5|nr:SPOCS domain-containing protein [Crassaminicella profunda]QZY55462.1 DUF3794 domain-containing protein [Crassaminicella profunda]
MAVELMRDLLKIDQVIGEGDTQALVEGEILVPDVKPDISRILSVDGNINITGKEAVADKIVVDGVVNFKILYASEGGEYPIYSMNASAGFSQNIDIAGTAGEMDIQVIADVEHIDFNIINERKIAVKTVVNLLGKSIEPSKIEVLRGVEGLDDLQILRKTVSYNDIVGNNQSETIVRESFEIDENLPEIAEILKCDAFAVEKEKQVTDGKVIINGVVKTNTLYVGDDDRNSLFLLKHEIPFTHFVEVTGAMKDMDSKATLRTDEVYTDVKENIDGDRRIFEIEAMVKIDASVNDVEEKEVVIDAYSPSKLLKMDKREITFHQTVGKNTSNMVVKEMMDIPSDEPEIFKVFSVNAKPVITDVNLVEDKNIIEGIIEADVLYISQEKDQSARSFHQEIPFRHFVEVIGAKENMKADVDLHINDIDYNLINPEQIEVKVNLGATCGVSKKLQMDVLVDAEELEEMIDLSKRPSMTIYYVQPGDTLWKIAKRYHTTVDDLVQTNNIQNPEKLIAGEQIVIQKTFKYKF